jgi:hypothetical protein
VGSWRPEDEERVSPTARWFIRGVWKAAFAVFAVLTIMFLIGVVGRAFD